MSSLVLHESLDCTIDRWENSRAVVRLPDGQELVLSRRYLPKGVQEGDVLELCLQTKIAAAHDREQLARAVLKEILHADQD